MNERKNTLSEFISTAPEFQYSINLEYDFNSDTKIKNYILTSSAMEIIEQVLLSYNTFSNNTTRARILIGPYGKGKSHLVLVIASILYRRDTELFTGISSTMKEYKQELYDLTKSVINKSSRLLPVIISANSLSISQNLMLGLRKALIREGLDEIIPDTYFDAAVSMIDLWAKEYKSTYTKLETELNIPIKQLVQKLKEYDKSTYDLFTGIFPKLTSGSEFNPIQNKDVLDQYKSVIEKIKPLGYDGIFVIYDEFSKFLEASVDINSAMEIKLLQDIAEYCNRSGDNQLHIMLTSHKDIDNYVDKLPKEKVDAWKAVNERFKHVSINNLESQTYEIMSKAIIKENDKWNIFKKENETLFEDIAKMASRSQLFNEVEREIESKVVYGCYPLHP
ncbi:MAG: restriction endonuclease subunit S, partial [Clostridiaceae bacterium]|nr:restriction endonuclease subunit S [Clostridiaceae bacterium]